MREGWGDVHMHCVWEVVRGGVSEVWTCGCTEMRE